MHLADGKILLEVLSPLVKPGFGIGDANEFHKYEATFIHNPNRKSSPL